MSLVNDMLRDLDARRRDAPARGLGSEKLMPATDSPRGLVTGRRSRKVLRWLAVILVASLAAGFVYLLVQHSGSNLTDIRFESMAQLSPPPAAQNVMAGQPAEASEPEADIIRALESRLNRLEEQNRELLLERQRLTDLAQSQLASVSSANLVPQVPAETAQPMLTSIAPAVQDPVSQLAPVQQALVRQAETPEASAPVRVSRDLSFADRDRQQVQTALQQWSSGLQLAALQTLDAFAFANPDAHHSRETLAKLLMQQGESQRALQTAELGLRIAPGHNGYRKIKARLLLESGDAEQAMSLLANSLPTVAQDPEYHDLLASIFLSTRRYDRAITSYQSLLQHDQTVGRWWYGLATSLEASSRATDAVSAYERALQSTNLSAGLRQVSLQRLPELRQQSLN
jgi:MSHA biogenesis protein MshN